MFCIILGQWAWVLFQNAVLFMRKRSCARLCELNEWPEGIKPVILFCFGFLWPMLFNHRTLNTPKAMFDRQRYYRHSVYTQKHHGILYIAQWVKQNSIGSGAFRLCNPLNVGKQAQLFILSLKRSMLINHSQVLTAKGM